MHEFTLYKNAVTHMPEVGFCHRRSPPETELCLLIFGEESWLCFTIFKHEESSCKRAMMVRMLVMGKAVHLWGQGVYGKSLYFPFNFAVNLKHKIFRKKIFLIFRISFEFLS